MNLLVILTPISLVKLRLPEGSVFLCCFQVHYWLKVTPEIYFREQNNIDALRSNRKFSKLRICYFKFYLLYFLPEKIQQEGFPLLAEFLVLSSPEFQEEHDACDGY